MSNTESQFNFLLIIITILVIFLFLSFIALMIDNNERDKGCVRIGYDHYTKIGNKIGICEDNNANYVMVVMKCDKKSTWEILFSNHKCNAIETLNKEKNVIFLG